MMSQTTFCNLPLSIIQARKLKVFLITLENSWVEGKQFIHFALLMGISWLLTFQNQIEMQSGENSVSNRF